MREIQMQKNTHRHTLFRNQRKEWGAGGGGDGVNEVFKEINADRYTPQCLEMKKGCFTHIQFTGG